MTCPRIEIDLEKIKENTINTVARCKEHGINVVGVTKVFCGFTEIAIALVDGGVNMLADSRMKNIKKLRNIDIPKMLLRIPMLSEIQDVIEYVDISLISKIETAEKISEIAVRKDKIHKVILMIDLGDLREGIFYENENLIFETVEKILKLDGVSLIGIGTNLSCYGGVIPTSVNLGTLIEIKQKIQNKFDVSLDIISGGNSASLSLLQNDNMPKGINHLRLGASLSLGIGLNDAQIEGLYYDAFKVIVEIVEVMEKPSTPVGLIGLDSFGRRPVFKDLGIRKRAICAIGKQDIFPENLIPVDKDIIILGSSSDHLILDITDSHQNYDLGDTISFDVTYGGCLSVMTSEYVEKIFL